MTLKKTEIRFSSLVISCEHAVARIPSEFTSLFRSEDANRILRSHRGYDAGAQDMAASLKSIRAGTQVYSGQVSRLLIDLNRSEHHRNLFSEFSSSLSRNAKQELIETYHRPYRSAIASAIESQIQYGSILHLSVHSFVPILKGKVRRPDIALLYDPRRKLENTFAASWIAAMKSMARKRKRSLNFARNNPFRGTADGCTQAMRKLFSEDLYCGVELELNQKMLGQQGWPMELTKLLQSTMKAFFKDG